MKIKEWLQDGLPSVNGEMDVVATGSFEAKADVLLARGCTHFVEDRLETCFHLKKAGIEPIVFCQPWNRKPHGFREVESWEELASCIRKS